MKPASDRGERDRGERIEFWQPPHLPGVRVLSVERSTHRWSLFHESYALTLVRAGHGAWRYRRREREIRPSSLLLIEPGNVHVTTKVARPASFETLYVDASAMAAVAARCGIPAGFPHFRAMDSAAPEAVRAFRRVHATLADPHGEALERSEAFEEALYELFRVGCEVGPAGGRSGLTSILRVRDRLHALQNGDDGGAPTSMAALAEDVGLTPIQLIRGFKTVFGLPPYQYLLRLRMARAQFLIARGPTGELRSLTDVAVETGFCDLAHMDRHFRRSLRVSPSMYAHGLGGQRAWARTRRRQG